MLASGRFYHTLWNPSCSPLPLHLIVAQLKILFHIPLGNWIKWQTKRRFQLYTAATNNNKYKVVRICAIYRHIRSSEPTPVQSSRMRGTGGSHTSVHYFRNKLGHMALCWLRNQYSIWSDLAVPRTHTLPSPMRFYEKGDEPISRCHFNEEGVCNSNGWVVSSSH